MRFSIHAAALAFAIAAGQASAAGIDFKAINGILQKVAEETLKTEQFKNGAGADAVTELSIKFDEKSDWDKYKLGVKAKLGLASSVWAEKSATTVEVELNSEMVTDAKTSEEVLSLQAKLSAETDVASLLRFSTEKYDSEAKPCDHKPADALEEAYLKEACALLPTLKTAATTAVYLETFHELVTKRIEFQKKHLAALSAASGGVDAMVEKSIKEEIAYLVPFNAALGSRRLPETVRYAAKVDYTPFGMTSITRFELYISPTSTSIGLAVQTGEGAAQLKDTKEMIESFAETLARPETDAERITLIENISNVFKSGMQLAKEHLVK